MLTNKYTINNRNGVKCVNNLCTVNIDNSEVESNLKLDVFMAVLRNWSHKSLFMRAV